MCPEVLVFSKRVWDTLPPADQAMMRRQAKESVPFMRGLWDEREASARKAVEAGGAQISDLSDRSEFIEAMKPVYAKYAATPRLQDLVQRIQAAP